MPVVAAAGTDHRLGFLDAGQLDFVERGLGDIVDAVYPEIPAADEGVFGVCCVPARAHRDQLAGDMLVRLLWQHGLPAQSAAAAMPLGELVAWLRKTKAEVLCISVVAPSTIIHARYLCAKFRVIFPGLKIVVGLWGRPDLSPENAAALRESGADEIVASLAEAIELLKPQTQEDVPVPSDELLSCIQAMPGELSLPIKEIPLP
jgi:hypothetical protein